MFKITLIDYRYSFVTLPQKLTFTVTVPVCKGVVIIPPPLPTNLNTVIDRNGYCQICDIGTGTYTVRYIQIHAIFATLVPGFSSPFPNMGLTARATQAHEPGENREQPQPLYGL